MNRALNVCFPLSRAPHDRGVYYDSEALAYSGDKGGTRIESTARLILGNRACRYRSFPRGGARTAFYSAGLAVPRVSSTFRLPRLSLVVASQRSPSASSLSVLQRSLQASLSQRRPGLEKVYVFIISVALL
jgi:hypothetical protein